MNILISVFTVTYNRCELLQRLYRSLTEQTCFNFEWIIIDDDSSDNTEKVVSNFSNNDFNIIYRKQVHGGKHRAINKGLSLAHGEYFFIVDSDDYLIKDCIKKISNWIDDIQKTDLAGIAGLKIYPDGSVCGGDPKIKNRGWIDATNFERKKYGLLGDKSEVYKTCIMREHLFPEFDGEFFITESVCWDAIAAQGKKIRWYNEPIYIADYQPDGLTKSGANELEGHRNNFRGYCYYVNQSLRIKPKLESITDFRAFNKTCKHMKINFWKRAETINLHRGNYLIWYFLKMPIYYLARIIKYKLLKC